MSLSSATPLEISIFREELEANMTYLRKGLERLSGSTRDWAERMCDFYETHERLTDKQVAIALTPFRTLQDMERYSHGERGTPASEKGAPDPGTSSKVLLDTSEIRELFTIAAQKLKFPKLTYYRPEGKNLTFYPRVHKNPGMIAVKMEHPDLLIAEFSDRQFLWMPAAPIEIRKLIVSILKKPVELLTENGKAYSTCCYCGLGLTDPRSIVAGYGPVCASNWELPWGEEAPLLASL
jgi:Family of unknown function (DUF6011)